MAATPPGGVLPRNWEKSTSADISDAQRQLIFSGNLKRLLAPILKSKGRRGLKHDSDRYECKPVAVAVSPLAGDDETRQTGRHAAAAGGDTSLGRQF